MLGIRNSTSGEYSQTNNPAYVVPENRSDGPPAAEKKIALFRSLLRGRPGLHVVMEKGVFGLRTECFLRAAKIQILSL